MRSKGFTLIELVVVLAIFMLIFGAATTVLLSFIQHQKAILAEGQALSDVSFMNDAMSQALRMAKTPQTSQDADCMNGSLGYTYLLTRYDGELKAFKGIKFINHADNDACEEFFLDTTDASHPVVKVLKNSIQDGDAVALSSENINIRSLRFAINGLDGGVAQLADCGGDIDLCGASSSSGLQPRVTITMNFNFQEGSPNSQVVQATVSQRDVN